MDNYEIINSNYRQAVARPTLEPGKPCLYGNYPLCRQSSSRGTYATSSDRFPGGGLEPLAFSTSLKTPRLDDRLSLGKAYYGQPFHPVTPVRFAKHSTRSASESTLTSGPAVSLAGRVRRSDRHSGHIKRASMRLKNNLSIELHCYRMDAGTETIGLLN